jgi:hypothetical protein
VSLNKIHISSVQDANAVCQKKNMQLYSFAGQHAYAGGTVMCTTACLNFCMACLSRMTPLHCKNTEWHSIVSLVMRISSKAHGGRGMISAFEAMKNIDTKRLGLRRFEAVCLQGKVPCGPAAVEEGESCIIQWKDLPKLLVRSAGDRRGSTACAIVTCNGHSIVIVATAGLNSHRFLFFDPQPSRVVTNIATEQQADTIMQLAEEGLNIRRGIETEQIDVTVLCKEHNHHPGRLSNMHSLQG